jgi:hypothetical protein
VSILVQPLSQSTKLGTTGWLSVVAGGTPFSYRWYNKDAQGRYNPVLGGDGEVLLFTPFTERDAGTYAVVVMDSAGNSVQSEDAVLTAIPGD